MVQNGEANNKRKAKNPGSFSKNFMMLLGFVMNILVIFHVIMTGEMMKESDKQNIF